MATGRQAFTASTTALIHDAILNREPRPPSAVNPHLPAGFDAVVSKALEKDRELRCQSAAELRADLKRLKRDAGFATPPAGLAISSEERPVSVSPPRKRGGRRMLWAAALFFPSTLILATLAIMWYASAHRTPDLRTTERQLTASFGAPVLDAAISPDGRLLAYADNRRLHLKIIDSGEVFELASPPGSKIYQVNWYPDNYNLLLSVMPGPAMRTQLWTEAIFGSAPRLIRDDVRDASVSPDGAWIAFTTNAQDSLWVMSVTGEKPRKLADTGPADSLADPAWSPGRHTIVYLLLNRNPPEMYLRSMARGSGKDSFGSFDLDT